MAETSLFWLWFIKPIAEFLGAIALYLGIFVLFILAIIIHATLSYFCLTPETKRIKNKILNDLRNEPEPINEFAYLFDGFRPHDRNVEAQRIMNRLVTLNRVIRTKKNDQDYVEVAK